MNKHYTVMVLIKEVVKEPDTEKPTIAGKQTVKGERVVHDLISLTTQAKNIQEAVVKAITQLQAELEYHPPFAVAGDVTLADPVARRPL